MKTQIFRKFCPVCKMSNDPTATICRHCGAALGEEVSEQPPTTRQVDDSFELTEEMKEQVTREYTPPARGMLLFLLNKGEPIALSLDPEFVLGRAGELTAEPIIDLTSFEGFAEGVSRRHAMIKALEDKYILIDLNSSNGTWLNGERLVPTKPYDLPSGGTIQLGRMKLVVFYSHPSSLKKG